MITYDICGYPMQYADPGQNAVLLHDGRVGFMVDASDNTCIATVVIEHDALHMSVSIPPLLPGGGHRSGLRA